MKSTDPICSLSSMHVVKSITLLLFLSVFNDLNALSYDHDLIRLTFFTGIYSTYSQTNDSLPFKNIPVNEEAIQNTEHYKYTGIYFVGIPDNLVLNCGDPMPNWPVVVATDNKTEFKVTPRERIEFNPCGGKIITRIWSVVTPDGTPLSREQSISYTDNIAPFLQILNDTIVSSAADLPIPYYEAGDYGCSTFEVNITEDEYNLNDKITAIMRTYVATDGCGNSTTKIQQIQVKTGSTQTTQKSKSVSVLEYHK